MPKKMEILATVKKQKKSVLYKNAKQAYKIFKDMVDYEHYELKHQEHFWIMGIDAIGYVVCVYIGAIGADNRAIIDPVDLFSTALAHKSKKVIIAHNHPNETKKVNPSQNDFDLTNKLYHACLPFGIEIIDHIIFTDKVFYTYGAHTSYVCYVCTQSDTEWCTESRASYIENTEIALIHKDITYTLLLTAHHLRCAE